MLIEENLKKCRKNRYENTTPQKQNLSHSNELLFSILCFSPLCYYYIKYEVEYFLTITLLVLLAGHYSKYSSMVCEILCRYNQNDFY